MLPEKVKKENNIGTFTYMLMNGLTFGILSVVRIPKTSKIINKISGKTVYPDLFVTSIQLIKVFSIFNFLALIKKEKEEEKDVELSIMSYIFKYSYIMFYIMIKIWAFKAKEEIEEYAKNKIDSDYKMNSIYTFVFDVFYINYCLNDLPKKKKKKS